MSVVIFYSEIKDCVLVGPFYLVTMCPFVRTYICGLVWLVVYGHLQNFCLISKISLKSEIFHQISKNSKT